MQQWCCGYIYQHGLFSYVSLFWLQMFLLFGVSFVVCAVRVIAESDIMQDFLASSEDNIVSLQQICTSLLS